MRILFVCARDPWPPSRGDQLRAVQFVEALSARHRVTMLAPSGRHSAGASAERGLARWVEGLGNGVEVETYQRRPGDVVLGLCGALLRRTSLQSALFRSADLGRKLRRLAPDFDLAILQMVRLERYLDDLEGLPVFVDLIDCLSLSFRARAGRDRPWLSPMWLWEAGRLLASERRVVERSAAACLVCERDRQHLVSQLPGPLHSRLEVVPVVTAAEPRVAPESRVVPGSRSASGRTSGPARSDRPSIILSGNLGYFPTREGAFWFLRQVWPQLRSRRKGLRLVLAGARPGHDLSALAEREGAEVFAAPDDLLGLIRSADVAIAPLFCGAGVPLKVLEAWAVGVPVVASQWAARGAEGENGVELLVAEDPTSWAVAVERLLDDPSLRGSLTEAGAQRLHRHHTAAALSASLERWLSVRQRD